jgi:uncharacterized membrane protein
VFATVLYAPESRGTLQQGSRFSSYTLMETHMSALRWIALVVSTALPFATQAHEWRYSVTLVSMQTADGEPAQLTATALNNRGEVVAASSEPRCYHWRNGHLTPLGDLVGSGGYCEPADINDRGDIVGTSVNALGTFSGFLWRRGRFEDLGIAPESAVFATNINERGEVLADVWDADGNASPWYWHEGEAVALPLATADDLNNRGLISGVSSAGEAALLERGSLRTIEVPPGAVGSAAGSMNDRNEVLVGASFGTYHRSFIWRRGVLEELALLDPEQSDSSYARAMNVHGTVVGSIASAGGPEVAVLWRDGAAHDLNALVAGSDPLRGQISLQTAIDINNRGQILVWGWDLPTGRPISVLLTPTKHP